MPCITLCYQVGKEDSDLHYVQGEIERFINLEQELKGKFGSDVNNEIRYDSESYGLVVDSTISSDTDDSFKNSLNYLIDNIGTPRKVWRDSNTKHKNRAEKKKGMKILEDILKKKGKRLKNGFMPPIQSSLYYKWVGDIK